MYIAQARLRAYWTWTCVDTGRNSQLFQNKKVKFCCRGRFLSSARMELILLWHLDPALKWNFEAKWNFAAKGHSKFDFGARDIPFWQKFDFGTGSNCHNGENKTSIWQKRKKHVLHQNWVNFFFWNIWIFSIQYTLYMCPGPINPQSDLCYVYWLW